MPIDVRQTVRRYNSSGHFKKTRHTSFPCAFPAGAAGARGEQSTAVAPDGRILLAQQIEQSQQESSQFRVVLNFATEVQNRLRAAKQ